MIFLIIFEAKVKCGWAYRVKTPNADALSEPSPILRAAISSQEIAANTPLNFDQDRFLQCWRSAKRLYVCTGGTARRQSCPRDNDDVFECPGEFRRRKRTVAKGHSLCQDVLGVVGIAITRKMTTVLRAVVQPCRCFLFVHKNLLSAKMCGQTA